MTLERQPGVSMELIGYRNMLALVYNELLRHEEAARLFRSNVRDRPVLYPDDWCNCWRQPTIWRSRMACCAGWRAPTACSTRPPRAPRRCGARAEREADVAHHRPLPRAHRQLERPLRRRGEISSGCIGASSGGELPAWPRRSSARHATWRFTGWPRRLSGCGGLLRQCGRGFRSGAPPDRTGHATVNLREFSVRVTDHLPCATESPQEAWEDIESARGRLLSDSLLGDTVPFALARVRKSLRADEAIVGWLDHELPEGTPRAYAYVIRSTGLGERVRLPVTPAERASHARSAMHASATRSWTPAIRRLAATTSRAATPNRSGTTALPLSRDNWKACVD